MKVVIKDSIGQYRKVDLKTYFTEKAPGGTWKVAGVDTDNNLVPIDSGLTQKEAEWIFRSLVELESQSDMRPIEDLVTASYVKSLNPEIVFSEVIKGFEKGDTYTLTPKGLLRTKKK